MLTRRAPWGAKLPDHLELMVWVVLVLYCLFGRSETDDRHIWNGIRA